MHAWNAKRKTRIALGIGVIFLALVIACAIYLGDYYHADMEKIEAFTEQSTVEMQTDENGYLIFEPEQIENGLIFYPGGKVEHTAYIPLMEALASKGTLCILVKMPFRLAVFDSNAADGLQENYPEVESWYIGGHSLGGSMAASHAAKNADRYEGLVLLASYSTADLAASGLNVISLYGSEDSVLNMDKYAEYKGNLPAGFEEHVIEGGCHAGFGCYGAQEGDGVPSISGEEQLQLTAQLLTDFFD